MTDGAGSTMPVAGRRVVEPWGTWPLIWRPGRRHRTTAGRHTHLKPSSPRNIINRHRLGSGVCAPSSTAVVARCAGFAGVIERTQHEALCLGAYDPRIASRHPLPPGQVGPAAWADASRTWRPPRPRGKATQPSSCPGVAVLLWPVTNRLLHMTAAGTGRFKTQLYSGYFSRRQYIFGFIVAIPLSFCILTHPRLHVFLIVFAISLRVSLCTYTV